MLNRRSLLAAAASGVAIHGPARAQGAEPGITETEIKLGQTIPYSGPASVYATQGKVELAYFRMINERGGVNGRKINLISLDDGFSPPRTLEQTRRLVESERVFAIYGTLGSAPNAVIRRYLRDRKVPHVLLSSGSSTWNDPKEYPTTIAFLPTYELEGQVFADFLAKERPNAKVAVLYQNDDFGRDYLKGFRKGLGAKASDLIVREASYEITDATVDTQMIALQASGADTFFNVATPKFAAQAIRRAHDAGWKPLQILVSVSSGVSTVLQPAGLDKSLGLITATSFKTTDDPALSGDAGLGEYLAFMKRWYPEGDPGDFINILGFTSAQMMTTLLERCGGAPTREELVRQATTITDVALPMLLPGVVIRTTPSNFAAFHAMQLQRFDGQSWKGVGAVIKAG